MDSKEIKTADRAFVPSLSELIDYMSISQIKAVLMPKHQEDFNKEIKLLLHDVDKIIQEKDIKIDARLIRAVIIISQMNMHIWYNKDKMQENLDNEKEYLRLLKLAHQLNGFRNSMKNSILEYEGISDKSKQKSNFETDRLDLNIKI